jgi:hypothetical protein
MTSLAKPIPYAKKCSKTMTLMIWRCWPWLYQVLTMVQSPALS